MFSFSLWVELLYLKNMFEFSNYCTLFQVYIYILKKLSNWFPKWHSIWWNVYSNILAILKIMSLKILSLSLKSSSYNMYLSYLSDIYFPLVYDLSSYFLNGIFWRAKDFNFDEIWYTSF